MGKISDAVVFQLISEFGDVVTPLAANPDATTINIEDPGEIPKHQPGLSRGSGREEDDELLGNDDSDKTEVQTCLCNCFFLLILKKFVYALIYCLLCAI